VEPTAGFEPATFRLQGDCSAELSYVGAERLSPGRCYPPGACGGPIRSGP
jgi:hypothetical protein